MVRRALPRDLPVLVNLSEGFCDTDHHPFDPVRIERALIPLLTDDRFGQVWVMDADGDILGYAIVTWGYSVESGGIEALLDEIYVSHQGVGYGAQLLSRAVESARDFGAQVIFLETESHNERVRRFYTRHGFTTEDSVWMALPLSTEQGQR